MFKSFTHSFTQQILTEPLLCFQNIPGTTDTKQDPCSHQVQWRTYVNALEHILKQSGSCSVVSDSLQLHGLQPVRLLCPWNSPNQNTGVDSHSLSRGSSQTGIEPRSPAFQVDSSPSEPPGKPILKANQQLNEHIQCDNLYQEV